MQLEPLHAVVLDKVTGLTCAKLALVRVDRSKGDQNVGMLGRQFSDLFVLVTAIAGFALGIDREDHRGDVLFAVMSGGFLDGGRMLPRGAEVLGHCALQVIVPIIRMAAAWLLGMGVDVNGANLFQIDHEALPLQFRSDFDPIMVKCQTGFSLPPCAKLCEFARLVALRKSDLRLDSEVSRKQDKENAHFIKCSMPCDFLGNDSHQRGARRLDKAQHPPLYAG